MKRIVNKVLRMSLVIALTCMQVGIQNIFAQDNAVVYQNLALEKNATASSSFPGKPWTPDKAVDGVVSADSRWSSKRATGTGTNDGAGEHGTTEQWLMVDLGDIYAIDQINIKWEGAFATKYKTQGSLNGTTWFDLKEVNDGAGGNVTLDNLGSQQARYVRVLCIVPKTANFGYSIYEFEVYDYRYVDTTIYENLALGNPATASSSFPSRPWTADKAVDGIVGGDSRWASKRATGTGTNEGSGEHGTKEQWLMVDLGRQYSVDYVVIKWEAAFAKEYTIQGSNNNTDWTDLKVVSNGAGKNEYLPITVGEANRKVRYVRVLCTVPNNANYGYSIYEFEVYDFAVEKIDYIETIAITNKTSVISKGSTFNLAINIMPVAAKDKEVVYTSSDETIVTISSSGVITAVGVGEVTITASSATDPTVNDTMELQVVDGDVLVSKLVFDKATISLTKREKRFLTYTAYPSNAINQDFEVTWTSSDPSVASVNKEGLVETKKTGTTVITVQSKEDPNVKGELTLSVIEPTYTKDYDTMQDRWLNRVVGNGNLDMSDSDIKQYVENIQVEGKELWDTLNTDSKRTYLWEKIPSDTVAADYTTQFTKIKKLALAFGIKESSLYQNKDLYQDIMDAITFMVVNKQYNGSYSSGNWWDWQIGCTQPLVDTLMILKDYTEYAKIQPAIKSIEGYASSPNKQWPNGTAVGANLTDIGLSVLGSAIIAQDDARMNMVKNQIPTVMGLVTKGDGLYQDGSLVQHSIHAYSGSYGNELIKGVGRIQSIVSDTVWEIKDDRIENIYNTISKGYIPLMHKGQMMSMVNGRSISRAPGTNPFTTEFEAGSETISNIMLIAQFAPESSKKEYQSAIKYWLEESKDEFNFYGHARDFDALLSAKKIINDESIIGSKYIGMNVYGSMDRVAQITNRYTVGLSMYSSRIGNFEYINTENKRGWYTGDGMLYLYNNDLKQYGEGYWPTIDSYRLPGTTVDTRPLANGAAQTKTSPQSWVGGATNGQTGVAGMYLNKSNLGLSMDLKAQKSWFFLDDKIVALGTNINGTSPSSIETIIENRMLNGNNDIHVNGKAWEKEKEKIALDEGSYVHLSGFGEDNDIGYYFPNSQEVEFSKETRKGKYEDINSYFVNDKTYENTFFKMGVNHGTAVQNGQYEYVLLPGYTENQTRDFSKDNTLQIVQNDANVQAIKDTKEGIFAMNVWPEIGASVEGITIDNSASIYAVTKDNVMTLSISNPKQNAIKLKLTLDDGYKKCISNSEKVTLNSDGSFTIDTTGSAGATHTIVVELNLDTTNLVKVVNSVDTLNETDYTPNSWANLQTILQAAKGLLKDTSDVSQIEINEMVISLQMAIDNLKFKADTTDLKAMIKSAELLDTSKYTDTSTALLKETIAKAKTMLTDGNITQEEVAAMTISLQTAIDNLKVKTDTTDLETIIKNIESMDKRKYTDASLLVLEEVINKAKALLANGNATQEEVDAMVISLQTVLNNLSELSKITIRNDDGTVSVTGIMHDDVQILVTKYGDLKDVVSRIKNQEFLKTYEMTEIYSITLMRNGEIYTPIAPVEVRMKVNSIKNDSYVLVYIGNDGEIETINSQRDGEDVVFETTHFSDYGIGIPKQSTPNNNNSIEKQPPVNSNAKNVSTGDPTNILWISSITILSLCGIVLGIIKKNKNSKSLKD